MHSWKSCGEQKWHRVVHHELEGALHKKRPLGTRKIINPQNERKHWRIWLSLNLWLGPWVRAQLIICVTHVSQHVFRILEVWKTFLPLPFILETGENYIFYRSFKIHFKILKMLSRNKVSCMFSTFLVPLVTSAT